MRANLRIPTGDVVTRGPAIVVMGVSGAGKSSLARRRGHFMPVSLLDSQLDALEMPAPDERVLILDGTRPFERLVREVAKYLRESGTGQRD